MSTLPLAFITSKLLIYDKLSLNCSTPELDIESSDYGGCSFMLQQYQILFRSAKITPTKIGQFVTLWKRSKQGPIEPFYFDDAFDFAVVCVTYDNRFGQFIFPKSVLFQKGILSDRHREGKRAFRVYPAWDQPTSKQAQKTQDWQLKYFYELTSDVPDTEVLSKIQQLLR